MSDADSEVPLHLIAADLYSGSEVRLLSGPTSRRSSPTRQSPASSSPSPDPLIQRRLWADVNALYKVFVCGVDAAGNVKRKQRGRNLRAPARALIGCADMVRVRAARSLIS